MWQLDGNSLMLFPAVDTAGTPVQPPILSTFEVDQLGDGYSQIGPLVNPEFFRNIADFAIDQWARTDCSPEQLADLWSVQLRVTDLGAGSISISLPDDHVVDIGEDASGWGWLTDDLAAKALGDPTKVGPVKLYTNLYTEKSQNK